MKGVSESMAAFEKLNETADPVMVETWEEQDLEAQISRTSDPSAMDVFDVQLRKGQRWPICIRP